MNTKIFERTSELVALSPWPALSDRKTQVKRARTLVRHAEPVLEVRGISKRFGTRLGLALKYALKDIVRACLVLGRDDSSLRDGEFWALDDISLTIAPGEAVGILGNNGTGKSTLLKLVYGVLKPDRGTIRRRGTVCGLLEIATGLEPRLSGHENIALWVAMHANNTLAGAKLAKAAADFSELGNDLQKPVQSYSSGMKARLSFALAASANADLLLIDELLAVGDVNFRRKCMAFLQDYIANGGALLLTSHWPAHIQDICIRALVLEKGKSVFYGPTVDALAKNLSVQTTNTHSAESEKPSKTPVTIENATIAGKAGALPRTGEPVEIRLHYRSNEPITVRWCFYILTADRSTSVTGEFRPDGVELKAGKGELKCRIPSLPLLPGSYTLAVAILDARFMSEICSKGATDGGFKFEVTAQPSTTLNFKQAVNLLVNVDVEWTTD